MEDYVQHIYLYENVHIYVHIYIDMYSIHLKNIMYDKQWRKQQWKEAIL